jgi:hypothetical protein
MKSPVTIDDGEAVYREVEVSDPEPRELIVVPDVRLSAPTPEALVSLATRMANALADIVEKRKLYAVISGRKYPQVEAWMTVARMDGVVAQEAAGGVVRREDGGYEATVEAVRLSDGAIIGRASALCGTPDDKPWGTRPEFQRRSMAVTRATGRVFRQQYSWVMALAGYEPTPAEEMGEDARAPRSTPQRAADAPPEGPKVPWSVGERTFEGHVTVSAGPPADGRLRQTPDGAALVFAFEYTEEGQKRRIAQVVARGALADDIHDACEGDLRALLGKPTTITGTLWMVPWDKDGKPMPVFGRLELRELVAPDWTLPAPDVAGPLSADEVIEAVDA